MELEIVTSELLVSILIAAFGTGLQPNSNHGGDYGVKGGKCSFK